MSTVPSDVLEVRKNEVREDESRKEQSLAQFHDWIDKHPFIKSTQPNDEYLLSFLRTRKYQMDSVFESFEKTILFYKNRADWLDWRGESFERAMSLYNDGYMKVLKERDSEGRRIVLMKSNIDTEKYKAIDIYRLAMLIFLILITEEETQLCGIVIVNDFTNVGMNFMLLFSIGELYDLAMEMKIAPFRTKGITLVGFPGVGVQLLNGWKMGLSSKIKDRLNIMNTKTELWEHFDKKKFTTDFDGDVDEKEIRDYFRKIIDEKLDYVQGIVDSYDVDMVKAAALNKVTENVGSFRKLEVD